MSKETYMFGGNNPSTITIGFKAGIDEEAEVIYDYDGPKTIENPNNVDLYSFTSIHNGEFIDLPSGFRKVMTLAELSKACEESGDHIVYMSLDMA